MNLRSPRSAAPGTSETGTGLRRRPETGRPGLARRLRRGAVLAAAILGSAGLTAAPAWAAPAKQAVSLAAAPATVSPAVHLAGEPNLGPNVYVFTPSMPQSQIQATVNSIASQQISNQFGTQRYALLFEPGTYGVSRRPADLPGGLLHRGGRPGRRRPATSPSTAPSTCTTSASRPPTARHQLHRAGQLLALDVQPDHQRHRRDGLPGRPPTSGPCPRPRRCAGSPSTAETVPDGLLQRRPGLRQRRVHRRLGLLRRHRGQRLAAAVHRPQQQPGRLEQRRLESGLLRGHRRPAADVSGDG